MLPFCLGLWRWGFWPVLVAGVSYELVQASNQLPPPELKTILARLEVGDLEGAEQGLRDWARYSPQAPEIRLQLARVLAARKDLLGCALQLRAVPTWAPSKYEALFREGQTWQALDRARDAERAFRTYLRDDPNHPADKPYRDTSEVELINLMTLEGRWGETRELIWSAFPRAADRLQREELLIMSLRTVLERYGPRASVGPLRRFVAADPGDFEARLALALAEHGMKQNDAADQQIAACSAMRPDDPRVWRNWLAILKDRGDLEGMREVLKRAPARLSDSLAAYRGQVLAQDGHLVEAFAAFEKAIAEEPAEADLHYRLALVARRLGRHDRESQAQKRVQVLRSAREGLSDALKAFETEGRTDSVAPQRHDEIVLRLASICRDLGFERDAREWARLAKVQPTAEPQP
ncbi:MAG: hypothetical protein U0794_12545 [Isosphaeraceae bacterium]